LASIATATATADLLLLHRPIVPKNDLIRKHIIITSTTPNGNCTHTIAAAATAAVTGNSSVSSIFNMSGRNSNYGSNDGFTTEHGRHLLPQHIRLYLEEEFSLRLLPNHSSEYNEDEYDASSMIAKAIVTSSDCRRRRRRTLQIVHVASLPSAQHQMWVVQLSKVAVVTAAARVSESSLEIDRNQSHDNDELCRNSTNRSRCWDALRKGNYCVVVRIWMGTSRWWNCYHSPKDPQLQFEPQQQPQQQQQLLFISQQEVYGYQHVGDIVSSFDVVPSTSLSVQSTPIIRIPHPVYCILPFLLLQRTFMERLLNTT
jgi:hypothetical protein